MTFSIEWSLAGAFVGGIVVFLVGYWYGYLHGETKVYREWKSWIEEKMLRDES